MRSSAVYLTSRVLFHLRCGADWAELKLSNASGKLDRTKIMLPSTITLNHYYLLQLSATKCTMLVCHGFTAEVCIGWAARWPVVQSLSKTNFSSWQSFQHVKCCEWHCEYSQRTRGDKLAHVCFLAVRAGDLKVAIVTKTLKKCSDIYILFNCSKQW